MDYQAELKNLLPEHEFFIGIDSDGCVFDSMEVKQKEFFIPNALKYFRLFPISKILRETWEFVNLYSVYRGGNRFPSLIRVFDLLAGRKEIQEMNFTLPDLSALRKWINDETQLGNHSLREYYEKHNENSLKDVVEWTEAVNREIAQWLRDIPPFFHATEAIKSMSVLADLIVVSQTPLEALEREWMEHDIKKYVKVIAGQEHGTKTEHIAMAAKGKYPSNKILLIGDAYGDLNAAQNNRILFYPIIPGEEERSWEKLMIEGLTKFVNGTYEGAYETALISRFRNSLPETPPWEGKSAF